MQRGYRVCDGCAVDRSLAGSAAATQPPRSPVAAAEGCDRLQRSR
ncbi:hypothetical protein C4K10_3033 [Pseudomonas chlororaphis subsp. aureofaciens]|nr:hypothetical protein C4K10_3033 [Pseudomonas chlororaphis subsp. aureofaciens]